MFVKKLNWSFMVCEETYIGFLTLAYLSQKEACLVLEKALSYHHLWLVGILAKELILK